MPTRNVLAVTFTNKAAGEMARRVDGLVLPLGLKSPLIAPSTCVRILRVHGEHIGLPKNFTIYDGIETAAFEQTPAPRTRAARPRPVPPRSLEKGLEVLVDHAVHHGVRGVARLVVPAVERHGGDIDPA